MPMHGFKKRIGLLGCVVKYAFATVFAVGAVCVYLIGHPTGIDSSSVELINTRVDGDTKWCTLELWCAFGNCGFSWRSSIDHVATTQPFEWLAANQVLFVKCGEYGVFRGYAHVLTVGIKARVLSLVLALACLTIVISVVIPFLRRRRRRLRCECARCGYSLVGSRSQRCSECGENFADSFWRCGDPGRRTP